MPYVLHIGLNKTGTTSIQAYFDKNSKHLDSVGVIYPDIGRVNAAHHGISWAIKGRSEKVFLEKWKCELQECERTGKLVVISSEDFRTIADLAAVADVFNPTQTKIILYVREHFGFLSSWYQQAIHSGKTSQTFYEFMQVNKANFMPIIRDWQQIFGKGNVIVREYAISQIENGNVVLDFLDTLNIPLNEKFIFERRYNPTLSGSLLNFARLLNQLLSTGELDTIKGELAELSYLKETFQGGLPVDFDLIKACRWEYREDRRKLREEFGMQLTEQRKVPKITKSEQMYADWTDIIRHVKENNFKMYDFIKDIPLFKHI